MKPLFPESGFTKELKMGGQGVERRDILRFIGIASVAGAFPGFSKWAFACSQAHVHALVAAAEQSPRGTCLQNEVQAYDRERPRVLSVYAGLHRGGLLHDQDWIGKSRLSRSSLGLAIYARLQSS